MPLLLLLLVEPESYVCRFWLRWLLVMSKR
ncbi:hypothetical protein LINGRAHAP2_LOCUS33578 [Linum grandiflorum]